MDASLEDKLDAELVLYYRQAFNLMGQGRGVITGEELGLVMKTLGKTATVKELGDMINMVDLDGNGHIDFNEFLELMTKNFENKDAENELQQAFEALDVDKDGLLKPEDIKQSAIGAELSDGEVQEMFEIHDTDGDGHINSEEFFRMMIGN